MYDETLNFAPLYVWVQPNRDAPNYFGMLEGNTGITYLITGEGHSIWIETFRPEYMARSFEHFSESRIK
jgi:hypothetical protein